MHLKLILGIVFSSLLVFLFPEISFAAAVDTPIGGMLCNVSGWADGNTGRGIATLAVVMLGILALLNKISWNMAIIHIVGAALLTGASVFITALNVGGTGC